MSKVNLEVIYKKVYRRSRSDRASPNLLSLAQNAREAASNILEKPTLKNVATFRKIENQWLARSSANARSCADEFEEAIRSKNFFVQRAQLNIYALGFDPKKGWVYVLVTNDHPGCIKIGSTTAYQTPKQRINTYKSKVSLNHAQVAFEIETDFPSRIEHLVHIKLEKKRVSGPNGTKSNEWFKVSVKTAIKHIRSAIQEVC